MCNCEESQLKIDLLYAELESYDNHQKELEAMVVSSFDGDYPPSFTQGVPVHELQDVVTAKQCTFMVNKIEALNAALKSALSIIDVSNCCDSPLYRDDIDAIREVLNGSK